jgi:hypothetical protein
LLLLLFLSLAAPAQAGDRAGAASIPEARWVAAAADLLDELTSEPAECFAAPADPEAARAAEIGRAAFRTPALLGGQAARAGISCLSCHRSGRDNKAFSFFGVSGPPGTADVTNSFFSSHRGDGVDNPVPIPDLGGPRERLKVDRSPDNKALETFIHGLVTEEFDGAEPPAAVLHGLAAYVRALAPEACPGAPRVPQTAEARLADARRAVDTALAAEDAETAALMLASARSELGRVYVRYAAPELSPQRDRLLASDRALAAAQAALRRGDDIAPRLAAWRLDLDALEPEIAAAEPRSLFSRDVLSRALGE